MLDLQTMRKRPRRSLKEIAQVWQGQSDEPVDQWQKINAKLRGHNHRIIDEPVASVGDLLAQLEATDLVVATRFQQRTSILIAQQTRDCHFLPP